MPALSEPALPLHGINKTCLLLKSVQHTFDIMMCLNGRVVSFVGNVEPERGGHVGKCVCV